MFFPALRFQDKHKFVIQLKKFLNELVQPSPNLPLDDVVDDKTIKAVRNFKTQWFRRVLTFTYDLTHFNEITPGLWAMIGRALGKDRLLKELREVKDNEIRSLLLGMDFVGAIATSYTAEMEACDAKIASIFGGKNTVAAANSFEPYSLAIVRQYKFGSRYPFYYGEHLSTDSIHLYGSVDGTRFGVDGNIFVDLYVPDGFANPEKVLHQIKQVLIFTIKS